MPTPQNRIRNFCIIAHIDHGKSTLADRFLEITNTIGQREMKEQVLDTMELERERGITIKLQPARMEYHPNQSLELKIPNKERQFEQSNGSHDSSSSPYILNLIDTPGHVDFSYEVSRTLAAVDGAILVVDASQGIEAQTLSTLNMAKDHNLKIIPVVNKIDLPQAEPEQVAKELMDLLDVPREDIIFASGKTGAGVTAILDRVIRDLPAPQGELNTPPRALVFDSFFDPYKGVIAYVKMFDGSLRKNEKIKLMETGAASEILEIGFLKPAFQKEASLSCGEIGYIITGLKNVAEARVGDTITGLFNPATSSLPGYQKVTPYVFAGLFTTAGDDYQNLREALGKLSLSDSSLSYEPENSLSLGFGFRCGFLGLLHMEIIKERLEREFGLDLIVTTPSVSYQIKKTNGELIEIKNPSEMPERTEIEEIREPWARLEIVTPSQWIGSIMTITQKRRGILENISYLEEQRAIISFQIPLFSIVTDYFDVLKSVTSGYASMGYKLTGFRPSDLVKLDILVNQKPIDTLSIIAHKDEAFERGSEIAEKLKDLIPKQNFKIMIQAAIGAKIIAREDITPYRKDVTAKLYGGDITRKRKLLEKQKAGKKKMKMIGNVGIPSDVFIKLLKKN